MINEVEQLKNIHLRIPPVSYQLFFSSIPVEKDVI